MDWLALEHSYPIRAFPFDLKGEGIPLPFPEGEVWGEGDHQDYSIRV